MPKKNEFYKMENEIPPAPKPRELNDEDSFLNSIEEKRTEKELKNTIWSAVDWSNRKNAKLVKILLKYEGDPNATDEEGRPAVGLAVGTRSPLSLSYLIKAGADVNVTYTDWNGSSTTPLRKALNIVQDYPQDKDVLKMVKLLIDAGAKFDDKDKELLGQLAKSPTSRKDFETISDFIGKKIQKDRKRKAEENMIQAVRLLKRRQR